MEFKTLKIKEIVKETPLAVSILFEVPEEDKDFFKFRAGQYITIKVNLNGEELRRSYSISSSPNSGELKIVVKAIPNGKFSNYANNTLKSGDCLEVSEPEGLFTLQNPEAKNIVGIVAGSGITPVISIIKNQLETQPETQVILIYGNKSKEETIYFDEIQKLKEQYPNQFYVYYTFSKTNEAGALFGRVERSTLNFVLKNKHSHNTIDEYFICGPKEMIQLAEEVLIENGETKEKIHYELFTSDADQAEKPVENSDTITVTAIVDGETHTFKMPRNKNILDGLLEHEIDAPYSCQGGICSSCLCQTVSGSAEMKVNHILMDDEIEQGLILSCQAYVTTDEITVDFDEV